MNRLFGVFSAVGLSAALLAGCQGEGPKQTAGGVLGGVGGAIVGAQFGQGSGKLAATALGALIGAYAGSSIGKNMDEEDRRRYAAAQQAAYSAPIGSQIVWNNPGNGHSGTITPVRDGRDPSGAYCREFQTNVTIGGQQQPAHGTACQQPDGSWKIISQ